MEEALDLSFDRLLMMMMKVSNQLMKVIFQEFKDVIMKNDGTRCNAALSGRNLLILEEPPASYTSVRTEKKENAVFWHFNPLNAELNPTCHLLALLGAHHIFHVSGLRVKQRRTVGSYRTFRTIYPSHPQGP